MHFSEIVLKQSIHTLCIKVQGASVNDSENNCFEKRYFICRVVRTTIIFETYTKTIRHEPERSQDRRQPN